MDHLHGAVSANRQHALHTGQTSTTDVTVILKYSSRNTSRNIQLDNFC